MNCKDAVPHGHGLRGHIKLGLYCERTRIVRPLFEQANQIQAGWGHIAARQIGYKRPSGRLDYSIGAVYFEFENMVDPEDVVDVPEYDPGDGLLYYNELLGSSVRDFLRIPISLEPTLGIDSDYDVFTAGIDGNKLTFQAQTSGLVGVHGRPFSYASNSKLFGVALVATPYPTDYTQDYVFARTYFETDEQVVKPLSHQLSLQWDVIFGV